MRLYSPNEDSLYYTADEGGLTPVVKKLIIINVVVFCLQLIFDTNLGFTRIFGLVPASLFGKLMLWQVFTYMFLHGGVIHLAFNMFALWMFGLDIERRWGSRRFLFYYLFTGVGAGIITYLSSINSMVPNIGASGAIFGILVAYGMMFPYRTILVSFIFPMKARNVVILFAVLEFFASFAHTPDGIGHFAHLGGMLFGYLYLKNEGRLKDIKSALARLTFTYPKIRKTEGRFFPEGQNTYSKEDDKRNKDKTIS
jgi:membrane associated rhomboid family serine protease